MSIRELTPEQANEVLGTFHLIDVRESNELAGELGRIDGIDHVPLATVGDAAERLAPRQPILVICRSGRRSASACETLQELGVADVTNLAGGMIAWNDAGLPVVRDDV